MRFTASSNLAALAHTLNFSLAFTVHAGINSVMKSRRTWRAEGCIRLTHESVFGIARLLAGQRPSPALSLSTSPPTMSRISATSSTRHGGIVGGVFPAAVPGLGWLHGA